MPGKPIRQQLMRYFEMRPGIRVYIEDICNDLNETHTRVQGAIHNMLNQNGNRLPGLEKINRGGPWIYRPNSVAETDKSNYEFVGKSKTGTVIVQDENGVLYKLTELE